MSPLEGTCPGDTFNRGSARLRTMCRTKITTIIKLTSSHYIICFLNVAADCVTQSSPRNLHFFLANTGKNLLVYWYIILIYNKNFTACLVNF